MESVTFVYSLATEQERQTEVLKNQKQNQLEKYRALIQKQMEKERAFLSFKKVEFLSRQEAKLGIRRPLSARARMGDSLPGITTKTQPKETAQKNGLFNARTAPGNLAPSIYRQRTHLGIRLASSKPKSTRTNTSPAEVRKSCLVSLTGQSNSLVVSSRTDNQKERKSVHFENATKGTRSLPRCKKTPRTDALKENENQTFRKR